MTEQDFDRAAEQATPASTGNTAVDGVISSLAGLAEVPVSEHVAIFESAHEQLRGALDAPAGPKPPTLPGPQG
ncbi:hypothetical protein GCM10011584_27750 [Nocardioides phosphati]|uniref:Uncharacterized protein n=1 Tax=Nocardioides phosphati TaxID=1867775 RepID=A0ABQ2NDQ3_9ACTN|nr:hypothetical protein [Nocardioides phosphati]GGO92103.1 hypothetical protein GCM10011584_27750 [Nocardioides phosphati]